MGKEIIFKFCLTCSFFYRALWVWLRGKLFPRWPASSYGRLRQWLLPAETVDEATAEAGGHDEVTWREGDQGEEENDEEDNEEEEYEEEEVWHEAQGVVAGPPAEAMGGAYHRPGPEEDEVLRLAVERANRWPLNDLRPEAVDARLALVALIRQREAIDRQVISYTQKELKWPMFCSYLFIDCRKTQK